MSPNDIELGYFDSQSNNLARHQNEPCMCSKIGERVAEWLIASTQIRPFVIVLPEFIDFSLIQ